VREMVKRVVPDPCPATSRAGSSTPGPTSAATAGETLPRALAPGEHGRLGNLLRRCRRGPPCWAEPRAA
jgi:hypothetical protein